MLIIKKIYKVFYLIKIKQWEGHSGAAFFGFVRT